MRSVNPEYVNQIFKDPDVVAIVKNHKIIPSEDVRCVINLYGSSVVNLADNLIASKIDSSTRQIIQEFLSKIRTEDIKEHKDVLYDWFQLLDFCGVGNLSICHNYSMCCMYKHEWSKALNGWRGIVKGYGYHALTVYDYNRFLKCMEMTEDWSTYQDVLDFGILLHPLDESLRFRYFYYASLRYIEQCEFLNALFFINYVISSNKPIFWRIDAVQLYEVRKKCIGNVGLLSVNCSNYSSNKLIISARSDGLGERLNAIVNGMILGRLMGYCYGFVWSNSLHAAQLGVNNPALVGHAIEPVEDVFSQEFISKYFLKKVPSGKLKEFSGYVGTASNISEIETKEKLNGWLAPRLMLKEVFDRSFIDTPYGYPQAFSDIKFSEDIERVRKIVDELPIKDFCALHLRSGDVFYGEYRKFVHYTYKGIVLPIAKKIIEDSMKMGRQVVLLGQDRIVLDYLQSEYKTVVLVDSLFPCDGFSTLQKAFFDIFLMIKSGVIYAGSSGFAKFAALVSYKEVIAPMNLYQPEEQADFIMHDLNSNHYLYPRLQTSFAYWYGYYYGRGKKSYALKVEFLEGAIKFDVLNPLYYLVLASIHSGNGSSDLAEKILSDLFEAVQEVEVFNVMKSKTNGKFNMAEFFPDLLIDGIGCNQKKISNFIKEISS